MIIAAAQTIPVKGDIQKNINQHLEFIKRAAKKNVDLIFFPELSLTGYEPELARDLAIDISDERLLVFKDLSEKHQMIIAVGAPIKDNMQVNIGLIVFSPAEEAQLYTKQNLHDGEEKYFSANANYPLQLNVKGEIINFAICADFANPDHVKDAVAKKCTVYLVSVLISKNGLEHDSHILQSYATDYGMTVIMANYGGISGGYDCAGHSSFWCGTSHLEDRLQNDKEGLLIAENENGGWKTEIVNF